MNVYVFFINWRESVICTENIEQTVLWNIGNDRLYRYTKENVPVTQ